MAQIIVCNLDDALIAVLEARARGQGRSLDEEVNSILRQAAEDERRN